MIESRFGRTDGTQRRRPRSRSRPLPEASDRDVRQPWPVLGPVDVQLLEQTREALLQACCAALLVVEDDHADSRGLAIAHRHEHGLETPDRGLVERRPQQVELARGPAAEERERCVQMLGGEKAYAGKTAQG